MDHTRGINGDWYDQSVFNIGGRGGPNGATFSPTQRGHTRFFKLNLCSLKKDDC